MGVETTAEEDGREGGAGVVGVGSLGRLQRLLRRMSRLSAGWVLLLCGATSVTMCAVVLALWWRQPRTIGTRGRAEEAGEEKRQQQSHFRTHTQMVAHCKHLFTYYDA